MTNEYWVGKCCFKLVNEYFLFLLKSGLQFMIFGDFETLKYLAMTIYHLLSVLTSNVSRYRIVAIFVELSNRVSQPLYDRTCFYIKHYVSHFDNL